MRWSEWSYARGILSYFWHQLRGRRITRRRRFRYRCRGYFRRKWRRGWEGRRASEGRKICEGRRVGEPCCERRMEWQPKRHHRERLHRTLWKDLWHASRLHGKDLFEILFNKDILALIVTETNRYARQKLMPAKLGKWTDVNVLELKAYLGVRIIMGINPLPTTANFLSTDIYLGNEGMDISFGFCLKSR